jgi:hypothetical protein
MQVLTASRRRPPRFALTFALAAAMGVAAGSGAALAQQNPLRALTDMLNWSTEAGKGPDFVNQSRPDTTTMKYSPLTGQDKKRVPVRTPDELKADMDRLVKDRERADAQRKGLDAVKVEPVAPNKVAPIEDE